MVLVLGQCGGIALFYWFQGHKLGDDQDFKKGGMSERGKISGEGGCPNPSAFYLTVGTQRFCQDELEINFSR